MPEPAGERLTLAELQSAVWAADSGAFLVLPRILRRVIKQDRHLTGFGLRVPHRKSYTIAREPLLEIVDRAELGAADDATLPEMVVLLAQPSARTLAEQPGKELLVRFWRLLYHARLHLALESKLVVELDATAIHRRIHEIGEAEFDEIRMVLGQEDMLLPPKSDAATYIEFAAMYCELRHFSPSFVPRFFPGLMDLKAIDGLIGRDVDAEGIFQATRPIGAPPPRDTFKLDEWADLSPEEEQAADDAPASVEASSERKFRSLMRRALRPASLGNVVRSAIYHARAVRCAPPEFATRARSAVKADMDRLAGRLQAALELEQSRPQPWHDSLAALAVQTPRGIWTVEARLLYDLQKACADHEREIYTIDLVEWALSWGRRPIKRRLPSQRDVLMLKHLRSAARRLSAARITDAHRRRLAVLLREAIARIESRLRERIGPKIVASLDDVGLVPRNLPERVARKKLVEELLDQIEERGFLAMGDLRDAISRNNLKLPDIYKRVEYPRKDRQNNNCRTPRSPSEVEPPLPHAEREEYIPNRDTYCFAGFLGVVRHVIVVVFANVREFLRGDLLLRANSRLGLSLDGVYRRAEFYLRWMQRISSLGFGTCTGRLLTRFAAVPFGGAFVILAGLHHVWEFAAKANDTAAPDSAELGKTAAETGIHFLSAPVLLLGLFLLFLVNSSGFRRAVGQFFVGLFHLVRSVAVEPILWIIQWPLLKRIFFSRLFRAIFRFFVKPLIWAFVAWLILPMDDRNLPVSLGTGVSLFLAANLLLNSRMGRTVEEVAADAIVQTWRRFGLRAIIGLFWLVVDVFKRIVQTIERLMYAVDEWLRFRTGESRGSLAAKAMLGAMWFFVAYLLRFAVNVLIEPQINPIKHFPVVTVSHKLLLPLIPGFAGVLELTMEKALAWTVATAVITSIPGVFGFLVWELKENWRLYAANRRRDLGPAPIGSHGETLARLLKPGFHSGTLPKRFAKLRRAERRARAGGSWRAVQKHLLAIRRVELSVRRFVEREFLELFAECNGWQAPPVALGSVRLATNCVRLSLGCPGLADGSLQMTLDVQSGWLLADSAGSAWIDRLTPWQRQTLTNAIVGLYKTAGVELVWQQITGEFPAAGPVVRRFGQGLARLAGRRPRG